MCLSNQKSFPTDSLGNRISDLGEIGLDQINDDCDYITLDDCSSINCRNSDLKVVQLNIRGLISKQSDLSRLLSGFLEKKIDVILCETWLNGTIINLINIPGYHYLGIERNVKKGGGVGFLVSDEIKCKLRTDLSLITDCMECCFIEIFTKGRNVICGSIYHPPNTSVKEFNLQINKCMDKIKLETYKDIVVGMDHNLNFLKSEKHSGMQNFITSMLERSLFPCITRPTRVTGSTATLIDNILVNSGLYDLQKSSVVVHDISDHFPSLMIIKDIWIDKREPKLLTREINNCKLAAIKHELSTQNWAGCYSLPDPTEQYSYFIKELMDILDDHIPVIEKTIPVKKMVSEPWLTKGLRKCNKKQLKLYKKAIKSGNNDLREKYKNYRSTLQKIKRNCKKQYYINQCHKFKSNTKQLWRTINNVNKKTNDKTSIIDGIKVDNISYTNSTDISNLFGQYFTEIIKQIASKGRNSTIPIDSYLNKIPLQNKSVFLTPCSEREIKTLIT